MPRKPRQSLCERVTGAAERCLRADKAVGILDVFVLIGFLEPSHFEAWKKGLQYIPVLEDWIQCGEAKWNKSTEHFLTWVQQNSLEPFEVVYEMSGRHGSSPCRLTHDGDDARESLYCTKFRRNDLNSAQKERLEAKAKKAPDLLVYVQTQQSSTCSECDATLEGKMLYLEHGHALCMDCADMAHLVFLPSGNATLTRRAKKLSPLSAVVLRFNRRRNRYERQGILATSGAIEQAKASCESDSDQRAKQRERAAARRMDFDLKLVREMTSLILNDYPCCPPEEAEQIASHTAQRGSGRVGRSAAGRALSPGAIELAVRAWVRHQHTNYDSLLMQGVERQHAREQIALNVSAKLQEWQEGPK